MVYREGNQLLKILLVFVISVLALTSLIYLVLMAKKSDDSKMPAHIFIPPPEEQNILNKEIDDYLIDIVEGQTLD